MITWVMLLISYTCHVILLQSQVKSCAIALDLTFDWRRNYSSNDLSNDNLILSRLIIITELLLGKCMICAILPYINLSQFGKVIEPQ